MIQEQEDVEESKFRLIELFRRRLGTSGHSGCFLLQISQLVESSLDVILYSTVPWRSVSQSLQTAL